MVSVQKDQNNNGTKKKNKNYTYFWKLKPFLQQDEKALAEIETTIQNYKPSIQHTVDEAFGMSANLKKNVDFNCLYGF